MGLNLIECVCPSCEGYGKAVDYFSLPRDMLNTQPYYFWSVIPTNSKGYFYTNRECDQCRGRGITLIFVPGRDKL